MLTEAARHGLTLAQLAEFMCEPASRVAPELHPPSPATFSPHVTAPSHPHHSSPCMPPPGAPATAATVGALPPSVGEAAAVTEWESPSLRRIVGFGGPASPLASSPESQRTAVTAD